MVISVVFAVNLRKAVLVSYVSGAGLFSTINAGLVARRVAIDHAGKVTFVA